MAPLRGSRLSWTRIPRPYSLGYFSSPFQGLPCVVDVVPVKFVGWSRRDTELVSSKLWTESKSSASKCVEVTESNFKSSRRSGCEIGGADGAFG